MDSWGKKEKRDRRAATFLTFQSHEDAGICERLAPSDASESGQTLSDYKIAKRRLPPLRQKKMILLSVLRFRDSKNPLPKQVLADVSQFLEIFFQSKIQIGSDIELDQFRGNAEANGKGNPLQYDAEQLIERYLHPKKSLEALMHIGITPEDLMIKQNRLVYGVAGLANSAYQCCLVTWHGLGATKTKPFLRRFLSTLAHESSHCFNIAHCIFYKCLMEQGKCLSYIFFFQSDSRS